MSQLHEEHFDVLTSSGHKTGFSKPRGAVHRDGDYHRAVHVWIFAESTQQLLLQKRADCKDSWPGLWDISSAGHISAGDSSLVTARRELQEELGLTLPKDAFELLFVFSQQRAKETDQPSPFTALTDQQSSGQEINSPLAKKLPAQPTGLLSTSKQSTWLPLLPSPLPKRLPITPTNSPLPSLLQTTGTLITNHLFDYADGTIPCPQPIITVESDKESSTTDNPSYAIANDAHVRMILLATISEVSFQHVQGTSSRDLWIFLECAYAPNTASREYKLKKQLLRITMKGDETPITYLSRVTKYATALANIGEPMKDKDLVMLTISGLREEYYSLKPSILARHPPLSFNELHGLLSDHDYMIHKPSPIIIAPTPQVFAASTGHPAVPQTQLHNLQQLASQLGFQLNPIASPNPHQPHVYYAARPHACRGTRRGGSRYRGNYNNQGRDNNQNNSTRQFAWASTQNTVYGHCNRCGIGHLPAQCLNQPASAVRSSPQANFANFSDSGSTTGTTWFPDTGANSHTTSDLLNLDSSEVYQVSQITAPSSIMNSMMFIW